MNPPSTDVERDEERDAELIDRLYGDDGADDLGELRAVRALVARVREEAPVAEPSPAIAATLLAAARERAPKEGLWARFVAWMSPVTSHPALAAAATLVVVAGAAALWMRGGGEVAEPKREDSVRYQDEAQAQEPTRDETNAEPPSPATESFASDGVLDHPPAPAEEVAPVQPELARPTRTQPPDKPTGKKPPAKEKLENRERSAKEEQALEKKNGLEKSDAPVVVTGRVDGNVGGGAGGGDVADKKKAPAKDVAPPPPAPPPEPDPSPSDDAEDESPEVSGTAQTEGDSSKDQARAVTRKARAEAEKNNCKNTTSYGTQVSNLDRGIYDKEFVKDRFIDACLRRARAKQTTGSGQ